MLGAVLKLVMFYLYQSSRPSLSQEGQPLWLERWDIPSPCATFWVTQPHPQSIHQTSDMNANTYTHTDILYFLYIYIYIIIIKIIIYIYYIDYIHIYIYKASCDLHIPKPQAPSHTPLPGTSSTRNPSSQWWWTLSGPVPLGRSTSVPSAPTPRATHRRTLGAMPWMPWKILVVFAEFFMEFHGSLEDDVKDFCSRLKRII